MSPLMRWEKSEQMKNNKKVLKNRARLLKPGDFTKKTFGNSTSSEYVTSRRALSPFTPSLISFWRFCTLFTCTFLGKCSPYWSIFVNKMAPLWADLNSSTSGCDMFRELSSSKMQLHGTKWRTETGKESPVRCPGAFRPTGVEKTKRISNARVPTSKYSWFLSPRFSTKTKVVILPQHPKQRTCFSNLPHPAFAKQHLHYSQK